MDTPPPLPQETIRRKRDGASLPASEIAAFVQGITDGTVGEGPMAAFAMAVCWRGMDPAETVALTLAMRDSGERLDWQADALGGPVVDKHATGGVGDTVSLILGPLLAACGCFVPMVSGRGLGHTGGTLDKLAAIPGYQCQPERATLRRVVREAGVAIVGAGPGLAPADQRLYAVRDVTSTVDSLPLIVASILSKKLAAGLQALVLDVKFGQGAFLPEVAEAERLARALVTVARSAGLPTEALLTAMDQPLAPAAGNAIEMRLAIDLLTGRAGADERQASARLREVVLALGAVLLCQCGRDPDEAAARARLEAAWATGAAAERLARMVHGLGGPADLVDQPGRHLARAPVERPVPAPQASAGQAEVQAIDTRALGLAVIGLGGGRRRSSDPIDPSVGLSRLAPVGPRARAGEPLAWVHAASEHDAALAIAGVQAAYRLGDTPVPAAPPVLRRVIAEARP